MKQILTLISAVAAINLVFNCEGNTPSSESPRVEAQQKKPKRNNIRNNRNNKKKQYTENLIESDITGAEEQLFKTLEGRENRNRSLQTSLDSSQMDSPMPNPYQDPGSPESQETPAERIRFERWIEKKKLS